MILFVWYIPYINSVYLKPVSYTHLDVYKRQEIAYGVFLWQQFKCFVKDKNKGKEKYNTQVNMQEEGYVSRTAKRAKKADEEKG